ncbi:MAG: hypothetical protein J2O48_09750, partial [Solirubrobacterales bacterium]|nr:hypothetical protein [Solirubrobacterales bacterium]
HDDTEDDDPENKRDPIESVRRVPASRRPGVQPEPDEEPFYDESYEEPEEFEGHPVQQHEPESSLNVGHDAHTVEYDVEGHFREEDEADEHILEETPDFLADTPDHDRLWFEQKPPPDFDFE